MFARWFLIIRTPLLTPENPMESTNNIPAAIKKVQLLAFMLYSWTCIGSLFNSGCVLFGHPENMLFRNIDLPYFFYQLAAIVTLTASYILLSKIATKQATTIVLRRIAIAIMLLVMANLAFTYYKNFHETTNLAAQGFSSLFFLAKTVIYLYLYGVIYRNNSEDKKGRQALMGMFLTSYVIESLWYHLFILHGNILLNTAGGVVCELVALFFVYRFFTSDIFSGKKSSEPTPKGTYKFWNKFFTLWLVLGIGGMIVINLIGILVNG